MPRYDLTVDILLVGRVFWLWQQRHNATEQLEIIPQYPGTNSRDGHGPTPGTAAMKWPTLDSPLDPFMKRSNGRERPNASRECIHIEKQLGHKYGPGTLTPAE